MVRVQRGRSLGTLIFKGLEISVTGIPARWGDLPSEPSPRPSPVPSRTGRGRKAKDAKDIKDDKDFRNNLPFQERLDRRAPLFSRLRKGGEDETSGTLSVLLWPQGGDGV